MTAEAPSGCFRTAEAGTTSALSMFCAVIDNWTVVPGRRMIVGIRRLRPDFYGGAVGISGRADHGDARRNLFVDCPER